MLKGQCDDIQESAILEGYRCKDAECSGILIRDSGMVFGEFCLYVVTLCFCSIISLWNAQVIKDSYANNADLLGTKKK